MARDFAAAGVDAPAAACANGNGHRNAVGREDL
jgi:hypothetical protein